MIQLPRTINEVIDVLDAIIEQSISDDNYLFVFAYVYRRTTAEIRQKLNEKAFHDNELMAEFDVVFANLYINAWSEHRQGNPVRKVWQISFEYANRRLAILQHLLLGMSAHINLDLAVAASSMMKGRDIGKLHHDFMMVNDILAGITNEVQESLSRVSPLLFLLDWIGERNDEKLADFSIKVARGKSWILASELWASDDSSSGMRIDKADNALVGFARRFITPRTRILKAVLRVIVAFESRDKQRILEVMKG